MVRHSLRALSILFGFIACFLVLAVLLLSSCVQAGVDTANSNDAAERVFSHRGAAGEEVEHTFAAYDLAIAYGSHNIELDVVSSAEGTLYVSHDATAELITGDPRAYKDMKDAEINKLKTLDSGESIHTVQEVFDRYGDSVVYVVELRNADQAGSLAELAFAYGTEGNLIVQGKNFETLAAARDALPGVKTLLIVYEGNMDKVYAEGLESDLVDIVSMEKVLFSAARADEIHAAGKQAGVWTMDTIEEIRFAIDAGADSYFTDFTAKAFAIERGEL